MITAGFVIAVRTFGIRLDQVAYSHGKIGVATLVLIYSQLLMGFVRPAASAAPRWRKVWDVTHSSVGTAALLLGAINVAIGVVIFHTFYGANLSVWGGSLIACVALLVILQHLVDRQEKYAVLQMEQHMIHSEHDAPEDPMHDTKSPDGPAHPLKTVSLFMGKLTESMLRRHNAQGTTTAAATAEGSDDLASQDRLPVIDVEK
eukprot:GHUV01004195.1.p1 GENE.GHUV01004195.1~~GHUV01004195.1.p1  ORF type:complete len:203 (+),score=35.54 GHUV01004195.1:3358-3966(+)